LGSGMFVFDTTTPWTWITIANVEQWCCLPTAPCINTHQTTRFGHLGLRQTGTPLPLVVSALLQPKERLLAWQRRAFCKHFGCAETGKTMLEQESELCTLLMADHPDAATTLVALQAAHGQGPDTDNTPDELEALTAAAFQEMDAEEQEHWKDQAQKYKDENSKAHRLAKQVFAAARKNAAIDEEADQPLPAPTPVKKGDHLLAQPSEDAVAERVAALRSSIPFVRPYVPGGPQTKELPPTVIECRANRVERTQTWVARYQQSEDAPEPLDSMVQKQRKDMQQVSKSKTWGTRGTTEHEAFQTIIQWLWDKHRWHHPAEVTTLPTHVAKALQKCHHCATKTDDICPEWAALQAEQPLPATTTETPRRPDTSLGLASAKLLSPRERQHKKTLRSWQPTHQPPSRWVLDWHQPNHPPSQRHAARCRHRHLPGVWSSR